MRHQRHLEPLSALFTLSALAFLGIILLQGPLGASTRASVPSLAAECGNGIQEGNELCDDGDSNGVSACSASCTINE